MKYLLALLVCFSISSLGLAKTCKAKFKKIGLCSKITWHEGTPEMNSKSNFTMEFWNQSDTEQVAVEPDYRFEVRAWMKAVNRENNFKGPILDWELKADLKYIFSDILFEKKASNCLGYWVILTEFYDNEELIDRAFEYSPLGLCSSKPRSDK